MSEHGDHGHGGHHAALPSSGRALDGIALSATLHCLTGCAIGEIVGMVIVTDVVVVRAHRPMPSPASNRFNRNAFTTTETLDSAIAAPASNGLSSPAAASGSAATL